MKKRILGLCCIVICCCCFYPGETYIIKMRLNKGDRFTYNTKLNMDIAIPAAGMQMKMGMEGGCDFEVMNVDADSKELKMTYTEMQMSMDIPNVPKQTMDSVYNSINKNVVGRSIAFKLSNDNQITEVIGFDSLMNSSIADPVARSSAKALFSKEQLNSMFGLMFSAYPKDPVKIGDSWNATTTINMSGVDMLVNIKYTLLSVKDNLAEVAVDGAVDGKGNMTQSGMSFALDINGTEKGTLGISLIDGYMKSGTYTLDVNGDMEAAGQKIPITMTGDCTMSGK
jgi:Family of unknown function (DUF6263)